METLTDPSNSPRVLFIQPHQDINIHPVPRKKTAVLGRYPSLGLASLAAYVREYGFPDVQVLDSASPAMSYEQFEARIRELRPDVCCITATTIDWPEVVALSRIIKKVGRDILVVVGGWQLYIYPKECLSFPSIDVGVIGDGEETLLELLQAFAAKRSFQGIAGTCIRVDGVAVSAPAREPIQDLEALPWPARDLFPTHLYRAVTIERPFATMTTVRGCPYACKYCGQTGVRETYRARSSESVFAEVEFLIRQAGMKEIIFFDETFTVNRKRILAFCERILSTGLKFGWTVRTRVDLVDRELLQLMRRAGCKRLQMGIESGSNAVLKRMNRHLDLDQVREGFALAREVGFTTRGYFMLGYLDEQPEETEETITTALGMDLDWASFSRTIGLPNTDLYLEMQKRGMVEGDFWRDYTLLKFRDKVPYVQQEDFLRTAQRRAYRRFYMRPDVIGRKLKDMVSPHALGEYLQGAQLFMAIQTEENRSVPKEMWRRLANLKDVAVTEAVVA